MRHQDYGENIILIGMPGTGKTTVGKLLAERLNYVFIDTDQCITDKTGKIPRQLVEENGREHFLRVQDEVVLDIHVSHNVIATGGGLVHSDIAMKHLKKLGKIVFLDTSYDTIEARMDKSRKLVKAGGTLRSLYDERSPLYAGYADVTVKCDGTEPIVICSRIIEMLEGNKVM